MKKVVALVLAAALTGVFSGGPAGAQVGTAIVAGPNAEMVGFATRVMVAVQGEPLTYVGADIRSHNVVSVATGPDTQPWCIIFNLPGHTGSCPLFWSEEASIGTRPVLGLENAVPGTIYSFYCYPHPTQMRDNFLLFIAD